ncbi:alkanesulfonate monooxygenase, partial [Mesorhizobium sp. M4B.F.Ca.ET.088.02.2.1]
LEEVFNVAELLFPKLGLSGEAAPAERSWDVEFGRVQPGVVASAS